MQSSVWAVGKKHNFGSFFPPLILMFALSKHQYELWVDLTAQPLILMVPDVVFCASELHWCEILIFVLNGISWYTDDKHGSLLLFCELFEHDFAFEMALEISLDIQMSANMDKQLFCLCHQNVLLIYESLRHLWCYWHFHTV